MAHPKSKTEATTLKMTPEVRDLCERYATTEHRTLTNMFEVMVREHAKKLKPTSDVGSGTTQTNEEKKLTEIIDKMNDLFSGELTEANLVGYVTTIKGKLLESETLAEQTESNTEQQFGMSDFKDIVLSIIIDGQESHNKITGQLLQDDRTFAIVQGMLAKMVFDGFNWAAAQSRAV